MKSVVSFLRSIIPADPWQLILLTGAIFLFVSPRLSWIPLELLSSASSGLLASSSTDYHLLWVYLTLFLFPLIFAGLAAYFSCFWSSARPTLQIILAVLLPALLSLFLILYEFFRYSRWAGSVLHLYPGFPVIYDWLSSNALKFPTGMLFCVLGLLLVGLFTVRIHLGISSLPLALNASQRFTEESSDPWGRVKLLVFFLICPLFLLQLLIGVVLGYPYRVWPQLVSPYFLFIYESFEEFISAAILIAASVLILGQEGRKAARVSVRMPTPRSALLGLAVPIGISFLISCAAYLAARVQWAASDLTRVGPPQFLSFFDVSDVWHFGFMLMIFAAFAEEVVFRGLLLRQLMQRYGNYRGIFMTGLIWAAFHFHAEANPTLSFNAAILQIVWRVLFCTAMNFVFAWMTLRWNSVIPSGIAHAVSNILVVSQINADVAWHHGLRVVLWALLGIVLFRYWPVKEENSPEGASALPGLENAV